MKNLYLIRHAKSSWNFKQLDDFNRPLGRRGRKDVIKIGKFLRDNIHPPDLIISSSANRAFNTALFISDFWDFPEEEMLLEPALYHADEEEILEIIRNDAKGDTLALVGHNPGFTDLANELTNQSIENLPTCAIIGISFKISDWDEIGSTTGEMLFMHYPKGII